MKRILSFLIILTLIISFQSVFAADTYSTFTSIDSIQTEYFDDGSYFVTLIETISDPQTEKTNPSRSSSTVTKSKTSIYHNSDGETVWSVKVTGSFTYGNGSATCNSVTPSASSNNSAWKVSNISGSKSGASATASATGKQYYNNTVINTVNKSVTLTCSPTGVFS